MDPDTLAMFDRVEFSRDVSAFGLTPGFSLRFAIGENHGGAAIKTDDIQEAISFLTREAKRIAKQWKAND